MSNRMTRRHLLGRGVAGIGALSAPSWIGGEPPAQHPHFAPRAKRLVYLFQSGGPSQLETFDHKPLLQEKNGEELPDSVRRGQRLTGMSGNQSTLPLAGAQFRFARHGESRRWVSELLPNTARHRRRHSRSCKGDAHRGDQPRSRRSRS